MDKPFAITLDVGSSRANHTGAWRTERPVYVHNLPPCNNACPAGENIQRWLYEAEEGGQDSASRGGGGPPPPPPQQAKKAPGGREKAGNHNTPARGRCV
jgi:hypothetical protein